MLRLKPQALTGIVKHRLQARAKRIAIDLDATIGPRHRKRAAIGNIVAVLDVIGPHVYDQVRDPVRKALSGQQVTYEYQMTRNGQTVFARRTLVPEITPDGATIGFFVFSYEITEQKRMQAALVQAQKMEAIGQLTGGLAHDFNNLLTVIIGNLAALQDHRPGDTEVNEFVEPALQSARRGVQLIKRLLTFSRQQPLEPEAVNIGELIGSLGKLVRRSLPESIAVSTDLSGASIHALVDPGQLESALLNFALNARDAMPSGGKLTLETANASLDPRYAEQHPDVAPGQYVMLAVSDTGVGIPPEHLARVFEHIGPKPWVRIGAIPAPADLVPPGHGFGLGFCVRTQRGMAAPISFIRSGAARRPTSACSKRACCLTADTISAPTIC